MLSISCNSRVNLLITLQVIQKCKPLKRNGNIQLNFHYTEIQGNKMTAFWCTFSLSKDHTIQTSAKSIFKTSAIASVHYKLSLLSIKTVILWDVILYKIMECFTFAKLVHSTNKLRKSVLQRTV